MKWLGHASFMVEAEGKTIYIDPYEREYSEKADLILVTHSHHDLCDPSKSDMVRRDDTRESMLSSARLFPRKLGVELNVEGRYRWIVFLPSRIHAEVPVLNRYYGVFDSGRIKVRGIEAVGRDIPTFVKRGQMDMIRRFARTSDSEGFVRRIPESVEVLRGYVEKLRRREVDVQDLMVSKQLSKHPDRYVHDVFQAIAAKQAMKEGVEDSAGQTVRYLITDARNRRPNKRVKVAELIDANTPFDAEKYTELLIRAGANILSPFGYTEKILKDHVIYGEKQARPKPALTIR